MAEQAPADSREFEETDIQENEPETDGGNGHAPRAAPVPQIMEKVTRSYMLPLQQSRPRVAKPPKEESQSAKSAREFLDALMSKPESMDYKIAIHRYLPSHTRKGAEVPRGKIHDCDVMPLDALRDEIMRAWGGGEYRAYVCEANGSPVDGMGAITLGIPVSTCEAKTKKFEGLSEEPASVMMPEEDDLERKIKDAERQTKLDLIEERRRTAEIRKTQAEIEAKVRIAQLRKLEQEALSSNDGGGASALQAQVSAMQQQFQEQLKADREAQEARRRETEKQMHDERLAAERRREELERIMREERVAAERRREDERAAADKRREDNERLLREERERADTRAREERAHIEAQMKADREAADRRFEALMIKMATPPPKDDSTKEMMLAMNQNTSQIFTALIPAITQKPTDEGSKQMMEIVRMNNESNRGIVEVAMKRDNKENSIQQQLVGTLLQSVLNPQRADNQMTPEMILKLIGEGRDQARMIYESAAERQAAVEPPNEDPNYDPKIGFLGNAGRAILGGLQDVMRMAASNPQIMEVVTRLFNKKNPTMDDAAAFAYRAEQAEMRGLPMQSAPPPLAAPPVQQQLPHHNPPMQQQYVSSMPPPVRNNPLITPAPMATQPPPMQPPPVQQSVPVPPAQNPAPAQGEPTVEQQQAIQSQIDLATELEGEAGMEPSTGQLPPLQPAEQAPPPTAAPVQQPQQAPVQQPPQTQQQLTPEQEASRNRLREAVTNVITSAITEIEDKIEEREWHVDAHRYWHGDFKRALAAAPNDDYRMKMIAEFCQPDVWDRLMELLANGEELVRFFRGIMELANMNRPAQA